MGSGIAVKKNAFVVWATALVLAVCLGVAVGLWMRPGSAPAPAKTQLDDGGSGTFPPIDFGPPRQEEKADGGLREDVMGLRGDVRELSRCVDALIASSAHLKEENEQLRRELGRLYTITQSELPMPGVSLVPRPGDSAVREIYDLARQGAFAEAPQEDDSVEPADPEPPPETRPPYEVVKQWGRSPEQAERLGEEAPSLMGMICLVKPGLSRKKLIGIVKDLRAEYEGYDNINIAVYDDAVAARRFAEERIDSDTHRVAFITKHLETGADALYLVRNGQPEEIPRN